MRTLKKALSLVLVLAMVFALAVPGFAVDKSSEYTDYADVKNTEAVDVLTAIDVLNGNDDGSFGPEGAFTRAQAATILAHMLMGSDAKALANTATQFNDVPATHWASGYIQYCANLGIIKGDGVNFMPDQPLTAAQWALMLLGALGYEAANEGIGGNGYEIPTTALAIQAKVASADDMAGTFNRDVAAKMAFNTLKATVVDYDGGTNITTGDTTIKVDAKRYNVGDPSEVIGDSYNTSLATPYTQFCEQHFSKLKLVPGTNDKFGRPVSNAWELDSKPVTSVSKTPVAVFTAKTTAADAAKALSGYKITDGTTTLKIENVTKPSSAFTATFNIVVNQSAGSAITLTTETFPTSKTIAEQVASWTDNGKLVEVYADPTTKVVTDVIEATYATVTAGKVTTDKKTGNVTYSINNVNYIDYADAEVADQIVIAGDLAQGDVVTFTLAGGVCYVYPTTTFEGAQTSTKTTNGVQTITVGGSTYTVGAYATGSFNNSLKGTSATYYVDQYGFVVKTDSKVVASTDYAYVLETEAKVETSALAASSVSLKAKVVLADGTVAVYPVALTKVDGADKYFITGVGASTNVIFDNDSLKTSTAATTAAQGDIKDKVFGYTITDGTISFESLTALPASGTATAENTVYSADLGTDSVSKATSYPVNTDKTVLVNNSTVYVAYNTATGKATVYTGNANLPSTITSATTGHDTAVLKTGTTANTGTASVVFFTIGSALTADSTNNMVFVTNDLEQIVVDGKNVNQYTAYAADGTTSKVTASATSITPGLYVPNKDGVISGSPLTNSENSLIVDSANLTVDGSMVKSGSNWYYMTDDTKVVYVNSLLSEVNNNTGTMILVKDSNNIAVIYVTAD